MVEFHVLSEGYLSSDGDRVGSTVSFAREGDALVVIDPGLVPGRGAILDPEQHPAYQNTGTRSSTQRSDSPSAVRG